MSSWGKMSKIIIVFFIIALFLRGLTLIFSAKNERRLKKEGAVEYGKTNTAVLILLHIAIYAGAFIEATTKNIQFDKVSLFGMILYIFSILAVLFVIYQIRDVWTLKVLLAKRHKLNKSFTFKYLRHPNYFLGTVPELISIPLIFKSWTTFIILFPMYLASLVIRINQEEKVMKQRFPDY